MELREAFEQAVQDALACYSDSTRLVESKLLAWLVPLGPAPEDRIMALRQLLREGIECLRPPTSISSEQPEWLAYHLLWSRYIQRRSPHQICEELSLSRSTFYRHQHQAVMAVASVLWSRYQGILSDQVSGSLQDALSSDDTAMEAAMRLASESRKAMVETHDLIRDVEDILESFVREQNVELKITFPPMLPPSYGDPTILRQILINLLTGAIRLGVEHTVELDVSAIDSEIRYVLRGIREILHDDVLSETAEFEIGQSLLAMYSGRLWVQRECDSPLLHFAIPIVQPKVILVVDDDEDTTGLYERLLRRYGYECLVARSGKEVWKILDNTRPDVILLDVLMPVEDGWLVLQRLQTIPETADVPVIVCSILGQPLLALSLGARKVLKKPVDQTVLLDAINEVLSPQDNGGLQRP